MRCYFQLNTLGIVRACYSCTQRGTCRRRANKRIFYRWHMFHRMHEERSRRTAPCRYCPRGSLAITHTRIAWTTKFPTFVQSKCKACRTVASHLAAMRVQKQLQAAAQSSSQESNLEGMRAEGLHCLRVAA
eukprot:GHVT01030753.1.p1 GENE.GHVT01030753.1~~GHVT01030753.1.p1  ORF type:complete len:131 (+),score=10.23 GHVT01030753.1:580-972(+)